MASVQFYGVDAVMQAAQNRNCPAWAMFQGRQFLFKSPEGSADTESLAMLEEILNSITSSEATYTLKFYEDLQGKKIKENTPCDGSFNFKLKTEPQIDERREVYRQSNQIAAVLARLEERQTALEEKLNEEDEEDPEPQTLGGILAGLANDPAKIIQIIEIGKSLFGTNKPVNSVGELARVAGAPDIQETELKNTIVRLRAVDPEINTHLEKLAKIAETQPALFKMLLQQLDAF